ncbi:5-(carboxyamino)imidazole ribonucleotide mutase [Helicobacter didelphidarum]|uniref:N5-carboxyaminoimidazole ribonucleotide mutase n=1 Tax=Helicobacter didelphidarum TaxID=2040648 RepID=A0A3D8IPW2_9HELI|nr:5-(carboxyamino)imidazole ribonucleotide mutase [Helicobacter didelphidarum]RDU67030.1 5-(carboxyamino)imidazole ribonucleotide mutase [Helicobacter didelphidarum]
MSFAVILMGSKSDWSIMRECVLTLEKFRIPYEIHISSAHRSAHRTIEIIKDSESRGAKVFIGAAGMAAHLAGVIAAHTVKPVIAVPLTGGMLDGLDSLLSSVQMPKGIPVATMSVGKAGAINAGYFVAQLFSFLPQYSHLAQKLQEERENEAKKLLNDTELIQEEINQSINRINR